MAGRQAAGKEIIRVNKNGGKTSAAKWREEEMLLGQYRSSLIARTDNGGRIFTLTS